MRPLTSITLRGNWKREVADKLRTIHAITVDSSPTSNSLRIICISDTHNKHPDLPPGDIVIHAGNLTDNGSFEEVQMELRWLSEQPHKYKILIAGNHDVLFDDAFLAKYPERRYGLSRTRSDLDWGDIIYLQDNCITLDFPSTGPRSRAQDAATNHKPGKLTIFGSPWTPQYGISAFQYRPDDESHWLTRFATIETNPDVIVTHGPPKHAVSIEPVVPT